MHRPLRRTLTGRGRSYRPAHAPGLGLARYPALPVLGDRLAAGGTVVLDDAERPAEQEVLRRWEHETGLDFDRSAERGGVAVATVPVEGFGTRHG